MKQPILIAWTLPTVELFGLEISSEKLCLLARVTEHLSPHAPLFLAGGNLIMKSANIS